MAAKCSTSMSICAARFTRLDPTTGRLAPGPNNSLVLTRLMSLGFDPVVSTGDDREMKGGCDQMIAQFKAPDILKRWNLTLAMGDREPMLEEMLTGAPVIHDAAGTPNIIGAGHPAGQISVAVAVEAWSKAIVNDAQRTDAPWIRWVWLYSIWTAAGGTLEAGFQNPSFTGSTKTNAALNLDTIYNDLPDGVIIPVQGGWFHDTFLPTANDCAYATAASS